MTSTAFFFFLLQLMYRLKKGGSTNWKNLLDFTKPGPRNETLARRAGRSVPFFFFQLTDFLLMHPSLLSSFFYLLSFDVSGMQCSSWGPLLPLILTRTSSGRTTPSSTVLINLHPHRLAPKPSSETSTLSSGMSRRPTMSQALLIGYVIITN